RAQSVVGIVFLESIFYASWSLLLLGLPMMLAVGRIESLPWYFYLTFAAAFLAFVPIPGAIGLLAAWMAAMWLPRSARRIVIIFSSAVLVGSFFWWARVWGISATEHERWLDRFLSELHLLRNKLLPSSWVTAAISNALYRQPRTAAFYLYVIIAHAVF